MGALHTLVSLYSSKSSSSSDSSSVEETSAQRGREVEGGRPQAAAGLEYGVLTPDSGRSVEEDQRMN